MELGKYKKNNKIDFSKLTMRRPKLTLWSKDYSLYTCGATAAATLTGHNPYSIFKNVNKQRASFSVKLMCDYLRSQKFDVIPLTVADVTNSLFVENKIDINHLLLVRQMYRKNDASWVIIVGLEYILHNFEIQKLKADEFIQRPLLDAFLLFKKSWR